MAVKILLGPSAHLLNPDAAAEAALSLNNPVLASLQEASFDVGNGMGCACAGRTAIPALEASRARLACCSKLLAWFAWLQTFSCLLAYRRRRA